MSHIATNSSLNRHTDVRLITDSMLKVLDARSRDIVVRRFGLKHDEAETLESIGKEYGITRERVRQIEANAKKALCSLSTVYAPALDLLTDIFSTHGGAMAEQQVVEIVRERLGDGTSANTVHFLLSILPDFIKVAPADLFDSHWRHQPSVHPKISEVILAARTVLKKRNHPTTLHELVADIQGHLHEQEQSLSHKIILSALVASKQVARTAFGDWGLVGWSETTPRGVGDKAYAVLRRHGQPAHFREITEMINATHFDHKTANPQTVHNELIKDSRFVLVGRGLYGLKEWGYMTGTVADVLEAILHKAQQPLTRDELIDRVLKQRLVKKNTILLSLQNNRRFIKTDENRYALRQKS